MYTLQLGLWRMSNFGIRPDAAYLVPDFSKIHNKDLLKLSVDAIVKLLLNSSAGLFFLFY
jgi:hypothetical protein